MYISFFNYVCGLNTNYGVAKIPLIRDVTRCPYPYLIHSLHFL